MRLLLVRGLKNKIQKWKVSCTLQTENKPPILQTTKSAEFYICLHIMCLPVYIHTHIEADSFYEVRKCFNFNPTSLYTHSFNFTINYYVFLSLDRMDTVAFPSWSYLLTLGKAERWLNTWRWNLCWNHKHEFSVQNRKTPVIFPIRNCQNKMTQSEWHR